MAKSNETFNKKEKEKKRLKKQRDKKDRAQERKANLDKGKTLEEMMAYPDENGDLNATPPNGVAFTGADASAILISTPKKQHDPEETNKGIISFFNTAKGFGFIREEHIHQNVFSTSTNSLIQLRKMTGCSTPPLKALKG